MFLYVKYVRWLISFVTPSFKDFTVEAYKVHNLRILGHLITPLGLRVTEAAGIRLSTRKVYKVATLEWKLTGIVNPDVEFDIGNRSGRSRAAGSCREIL